MEKNKSNKTKDIVYVALFSVIIAICSWISIPAAVSFTMQTFAVFFTLEFLGGKRGFCAVLVYVLLGAIGLPVFSGFSGGIGVLLGSTGGYIIGFVLTAALYGIITKIFGHSTAVSVAAMILGLIICYAFGTAWFMLVYTRNTGSIGITTALSWCVLPFIIPDAIKITLALLTAKKLSKSIKNR